MISESVRALASKEEALFQIGKYNLSPEVTAAVSEAFNTHEIVKVSVLKGATEDPKEMAEALAERTKSVLVTVIGRKIVLYTPFKEPEIILPKA